MNLNKTLIITLDDFIYDLFELKKELWKQIEIDYKIEISDYFIMAYYDAHLEKREKLGREYPKLASYFNEVDRNFIKIIESGKLKINKEHLAYLALWENEYKLIYCTNLSINLMRKILVDTQFPLAFDFIISSKQVLNAKPEGDIYLKVARTLNVKANTLTVIDSTLNGIQAAYLANSKGLYLAQFQNINSMIKKFAYAHFLSTKDLSNYVLQLISQNE